MIIIARALLLHVVVDMCAILTSVNLQLVLLIVNVQLAKNA